jgi:hypothetical protein
MTKYTCWKDYDRKVEGAIEGTKEKVHAWIQERLMASSVGGSGTAFLEKWVNTSSVRHGFLLFRGV